MSLQMSTRARYGVRLMVALAINYGNGISLLKDIARREGISEKYLGQIVIPLKSAQLVASQRGSHGGYSLARPPEDITVRDVVEAIRRPRCPCAVRGGGRLGPRVTSRARPSASGQPPASCRGCGRSSRRTSWSPSLPLTLAGLARQTRELEESTTNYVI